MKSTEELIRFWKEHYRYFKNKVDRIDSGEVISANSIAGATDGQRQHCVNEANIACDRLADLGNYDLPKIS